MSSEVRLLSKFLILDNCAEHSEKIKQFCDQNSLIGLKAHSNNVMSVLNSNVDLGAILIAENYLETLVETAKLAGQIRAARPELPIVLCRISVSEFELPATFSKLFCASYTIDDMSPLSAFIDEYIFNIYYPNILVRGISDISLAALANQFSDLNVSAEPPYIVRDRFIFGEVFSLIQLESSWCRGYMMLQVEEDALLDKLVTANPGSTDCHASFRTVNNILGEVTNLIWGGFKNRFIADDDPGSPSSVQVPIVINHQHKYISFGSENPQLCFKYTLSDGRGKMIPIYQWFVFNLNWSPEDFKDIQLSIDDLVDSGELELF